MIELPARLRESSRSDPEREAWLTRLPAVVDEVAARWRLSVAEPYEPGGECAWVAPARGPGGSELVLKIAWRHFEADQEADGLRVWDGDGAVRVHAAEASESCSVLLLERCRPGTALGETVSEPEQDLVIAALLPRLWRAPTRGFRALETMCEAWAASYQQRCDSLEPVIDPGLARAAIELLRTLPASAPRQALLATDLHAGNVLAAEREPWLVIDPKPYAGDPAYDVVQHLLNCERLLSDPHRLALRMADLLELDGERVVRWLFARCAQESFEQPGLRAVATRLARPALG